jgi:hypothetical protein
MKNTIRVHRNGDTQTASAQTKISRRKTNPPFCFAIHQQHGDVGDRRLLAGNIHLSIDEWKAACRAANQYRTNDGKKSPGDFFAQAIREKTAQVQSQPATTVPVQILVADQSPAETRLLIPSQVSHDTEAALLEMERVGNAAVAFVMMNAYLIANSSENFAGWEELNAPGFSKGALELARLASHDFQDTFGDLSIVARKAMEKIKGMHDPVKKEDHSDFSAVVAIDPKESRYRIANVVGALAYCIDLQSWALCCAPGEAPQFGCFEIREKLEVADKSIERTTMDLLNLFCVATAFEKGGTR